MKGPPIIMFRRRLYYPQKFPCCSRFLEQVEVFRYVLGNMDGLPMPFTGKTKGNFRKAQNKRAVSLEMELHLFQAV